MKKLILKNKKLIISITLFLLVFCLLGIPFTNWWFNGGDDFHGLFLGFKTKTWKNLFYFFLHGHTNQGGGPSNITASWEKNTTFFGTYYRPLYCIYLTLQYWIFGTNAYAYFLTNVFFHAINTVLLFNIFLWFIACFPAFLAALLFAFHPQIAYRFGAIVNLHYYVNITFLLFMFIFLKKYIDSKKIIFYILSCILFALSLFTRETSIVIPTILFFGSYLYQKKKNILDCIKITSGFATIAIGFLSFRAYLYPIMFSSSQNKVSLVNQITQSIPAIKVFIYDMFSLSWLPWGQKMTRGIIIVSLLSLTMYLFIKNTKKIYIVYFFCSALLMLWPAYKVNYNPRYFYESYPFIIVGFIILLKYYNGHLVKLKKVFISALTISCLFFITFCIESFTRRETKMNLHATAVKELLQNPIIKNKSLCFLGYPADGLGGHFAGLIWTLKQDPSIKAYFDTKTAITQLDSNLVKPTKYRNIISEYYSKNFLKITPTSKGFRFTSLNPEKVAFSTQDPGGYSMGKKIDYKKEKIRTNGFTITTDFELVLDKKYLKENILYFTWDYTKQNFVQLKRPS